MISDAKLSTLINTLESNKRRFGLSLHEEVYLVLMIELQARRAGQIPHPVGEQPTTVTGKLNWLAQHHLTMELRHNISRPYPAVLELYDDKGMRTIWCEDHSINLVVGDVFDQVFPKDLLPGEHVGEEGV